ncbi:MAG: hypothetical protein D6765_02295 [Bacteroidetes bacterium]|nr:MAG: hypothetical protein D6765_02295 [Bacteroidota bacterium]
MAWNLFGFGILLLLAGSQVLVAQQNWKPALEKEGIRVLTAKAPGKKFKSYRVEARVKAPLQRVLNALLQPDSYCRWIDRCLESRRLENSRGDTLWVYSATDAPWPVSDRDNVTRLVLHSCGSDSIRIELRDFPEKMPPRKGRQRIPSMEGFWELKAQSPGETSIVQQISADPGGSLPAWFVNQFLAESPFKTMRNLKRLLEKAP